MNPARLALLASPVLCAAALAGPLGTGFTSGNIRAAGFPDPLRQTTLAPVGQKSGSGGGSTGGGFGGFASADAGIIDTDSGSTLSLSGFAFHNLNDGYTASYAATPLVLGLTKATSFAITDSSTVDGGTHSLVSFESITGSVWYETSTTGTLSAGMYRVRFGVAAGRANSFGPTVVSEWYGPYGTSRVNSSSLDWKMLLKPMAETYTLGNFPSSSVYYVQGQSFTPSSFGNAVAPPAPASTPKVARLQWMSIAFDLSNAVPPPVLRIFDAPPTPAAAASGAGSRATGVHVGDGFYKFDGVALDYHTKYYAVLPEAANIFDGGGDPYPGGVDMFIRADLNPVVIGEGYGTFDIGFDATFDYLPGCAADLNTDGLVEDTDFVLFATAYDTFDCFDPAMPVNCPANLNGDLVVDDADFVAFALAYNELLCP
ncbi:MAG: hypothetical protein U0570_05165 [Phycisphaerales bacterium]